MAYNCSRTKRSVAWHFGYDLSSGCEEIQANSPSTSAAENSPTAKKFNYTDLVEKCTFGQCFVFSDDENIRDGIEEGLLNIAYKISLDYKKLRAGQEKNWNIESESFMLWRVQ